jgi:pimeloyl-ACP methyl ester carboxylesterase
VSTATTRTITTARGLECEVQVRGADAKGTPIVFLHSLIGLFHDDEPLLDALAANRPVYAPVWPGFGAALGEEALEDMLDFTLHGWDVLTSLGLDRPHLVGHGFGGMIAAEMAALAPTSLATLSLLAPYGLWIDAHPLVDPFTVSPFDVPKLLFADADRGGALLSGGSDFTDATAITDFMVGNSRRLGMAGKVLFPIPNRRLSKRLYRVTTPTTIIWGGADGLIPADPYAAQWEARLPGSTTAIIPAAGHQLGHDDPASTAAAIARHVGSRT